MLGSYLGPTHRVVLHDRAHGGRRPRPSVLGHSAQKWLMSDTMRADRRSHDCSEILSRRRGSERVWCRRSVCRCALVGCISIAATHAPAPSIKNDDIDGLNEPAELTDRSTDLGQGAPTYRHAMRNFFYDHASLILFYVGSEFDRSLYNHIRSDEENTGQTQKRERGLVCPQCGDLRGRHCERVSALW